MDKQIAVTLLESLVERIERDEQTGKLKLAGVITEKEYKALGIALQAFCGRSASSVVTEPSLSPKEIEEIHEELPLNLDSLVLDEPENNDVLLCLDFGTAMSKAFATDGLDDELVDLEIGREAGQTGHIYALISSIFITDGGKILFGHRAVAESTSSGANVRRRFDSIKDILCKDVVCDLDDSPLDKAYNPTDISLSKGDMVSLFLAYFTDMASSQLEGKGYSRYVRRRFTRPVLPPDRAPWAEDQLRLFLARAQVLADTLHGKWKDGVDVTHAKQILDQIRTLEEIPTYLIDEGVVEPVAAVGSRVRNYKCRDNIRRLLIVVDVGAGTIDYALFAEIHKKGGKIQVFEVPGSVQVLRQAGDAVDKLLRRYILKISDISTTDSDFHMIDAELALRIRQLKEQLFREGQIEYVLSNDRSGVISQKEFLEQPGVRELEKAIHEKFNESINNADDSYITGLGINGGLVVVFTGGGASLPMIQSLGRHNITIHNHTLQMMPSQLIPIWVSEDYPELEFEFPQLAVSIGGASRSLPVLAPRSFKEFGGLEATGWTIPPSYKGS